MKYRSILAAAAAALALVSGSLPVQAQITVYDPTNHIQNVTQAARALDQINNQIRSIQNEAQMLVNQARNLASLPYSSLQRLQASVRQTQQLLGQAQRIAYDVRNIDEAFTSTYASPNGSTSDTALLESARERWRNSMAALQDAMRVQAGIVGNIDTNRVEMEALVTRSQSATGALAATQAGNQLLALQSQQLSDLTAALAAQGRAQNLEAAQRAAAQDQGRERLRRFLTPGRGYRPTQVDMFPNARPNE